VLEREGLVQSKSHRGVVVFEPSGTDLCEFYEIRVPLEALATELAASNLTERVLEKMATLLTRLNTASSKSNWKLASELNDEFHLTIYAAAQRPRLYQLIAELRASSRAHIAIFPKVSERIEQTKYEHEMIYEACQARRPKKAAKAMAVHLEHTVGAISEVLGDGSSG